MKLFSIKLSHYAARVRIALLLKGLTADIIAPAADGALNGLMSPDYRAANPSPTSKVPCLVTDDGFSLGESNVILEYLEDAYPDPPLMPGSASDKARVRLATRICEFYVTIPLQALFAQMNPAHRDAAMVDVQLGKMDTGLTWLEQHMDDGAFAIGDCITLADCVLPTTLRYVADFARLFDRPTLAANHPKILAYMKSIRAVPEVDAVLSEMEAASVQFRSSGRMT